jgi:hypothetical protein
MEPSLAIVPQILHPDVVQGSLPPPFILACVP